MDILYQIVFVVVIIATLMLILVLWRLYLVLTDINDSTKITKRRVRDFDLWLSSAEAMARGYKNAAKGALETINQIKLIKKKISALWEDEDSSKSESKKEGKNE